MPYGDPTPLEGEIIDMLQCPVCQLYTMCSDCMRMAEGLAKWFASTSNLYPPYVLRPPSATSHL